MNTKEKFKDFVKKNPALLNYIKDGEMTWQKFYEIYDMYGESSEAWKDYLKVNATGATATVVTENTSFDIMNFIKNIVLDNLQEGVNSVQRVLGLLQDMSPSKKNTATISKPRPLYKHFED